MIHVDRHSQPSSLSRPVVIVRPRRISYYLNLVDGLSLGFARFYVGIGRPARRSSSVVVVGHSPAKGRWIDVLARGRELTRASDDTRARAQETLDGNSRRPFLNGAPWKMSVTTRRTCCNNSELRDRHNVRERQAAPSGGGERCRQLGNLGMGDVYRLIEVVGSFF